jgi:hypothetical protein
LKPASTNDLYHLSHKTKCIVHQSNNNVLANGTPTTFQFDTFLTALQNAIWTGWKVRCEVGKALCLGEQAKQNGTVPATKQ